jgi:hypothetical protein
MLVYNSVRIVGVVCMASLTEADDPGALRRPRGEPVMAQPSTQKRERVEIRIRNVSDLDFDRVRVHFPEGRDVDYGPVPKGGRSGFQSIGRAYRYAGLSVKAGKQELTLQPIDYLGEKELPAGRYAYALGVDDGRLTIHLEEVK